MEVPLLRIGPLWTMQVISTVIPTLIVLFFVPRWKKRTSISQFWGRACVPQHLNYVEASSLLFSKQLFVLTVSFWFRRSFFKVARNFSRKKGTDDASVKSVVLSVAKNKGEEKYFRTKVLFSLSFFFSKNKIENTKTKVKTSGKENATCDINLRLLHAFIRDNLITSTTF